MSEVDNTEVVEEVVTVEDPIVEPVVEETPVVPMTEIEAAAAEQGWSPEKGDMGALDFLKNGRVFRDRMYDEIKELRTENEKVYGIVAENISRQEQKEVTQHNQGIETQINEAVEAGDVAKVNELRGRVAPPPQRGPNPEEARNVAYINNWRATNAWFQEDPSMRDDALGFYQSEKIKTGVDNPSEILPKVLERIKKVYPNKFSPPPNPNENRGSGAESSGKVTKDKASGLKRADLTEEESAHIADFVKMGMDEAKLIKSIERGRQSRGQ